jgi:ATP-binding cassette ChvD family protein
MSDYVFTMQNLTKIIDGKTIVEALHLSFLPGAKIGVLGANGAGKSTILRIMAGEDDEFTGQAYPAKGLRIGYYPQEPVLDETRNVIDTISEGAFEVRALLDEFDKINDKLAEDISDDEMQRTLDRLSVVQEKIDACDGFDLSHKLERAMDALRCPPGDQLISELSGGEKRRVAMCRLLISAPDMLLLDEPTNHFDAETVAWLERHLQEFTGTVVAITHDRYFLDNAAGWILELTNGRGIPFEGNYSAWLGNKYERQALDQRKEASRQRVIAKELEWIRSNPKGRRAKSKARISAFENLTNREIKIEEGSVELVIPPGPRLGDKVIVAENLKKVYGDRIIFENVNFIVPAGAIVGIVGANGAGKTTLFRLLTGEQKADSGNLEIGETVQFSYVDQSRASLDPEKTIYEEISRGEDLIKIGRVDMPARAWLSRFGFKGGSQQKKTGILSGGERNRVHLAKTLKSAGNVILLDEPTNDLDVDTLRVLEEALLDFAGCALIISHDRWFLDRVATHILAFEDEGIARWFEGGWKDYAQWKRKEFGESALDPHRIKYKRISM